jgi:gliding motility-associated-like protein
VPSGTNVLLTVSTGSCSVNLTVNAPNCNCPPITPPTAASVSYCAGELVPGLTATPPTGFVVDWFNVSTGGTPVLSGSNVYSPGVPGTWWVESRDPGTGCVSSQRTEVSVIENALPLVSASPGTEICSGTSVLLTANGASSYSWSPPGGLSAVSGNTVNANPTSTTTYTVVGTDDNGCSANATVEVEVNPIYSTSVSANICSGSSYILPDGSSVSVAGSYPVTLSTVAGCDSVVTTNLSLVNPSNSTINASICAESSYTLPDGSSVSEAGSYLFTFTSAAGCDSIVTVNLTVDSAINITLSEDVEICPGTSINLTASGADSYLWLPATGLSDSTGSSVVANPMTTTNYVVYGNSGLCSDVDTVTVTVLPGPQLQIDPSAAAICVGDTLSLVASGADVLIWSDTSGVSLSCDTCSTALAYPQESMTFILTGSVGQCSATTSVTVDVVPAVIAAISGDTTLCLGETVQLTASGGSSYNWSTGDSLAVVNVTVPASTFVTVEVSNGVCTDSATTALLVYPIPLVNAGEDTLIHYGTSAQIMASSNASGTWFPVNHLTCGDCLEPIADPPSTTTYCLTVVNSFGCAATDCIEITVDTLCADLFIPNVFAPDDAGHTENNCFKLYGADCIGTMTLTIYNRWGEKVFVSSNPDECWDGNFRGKPLNTGVYVYYLEAELITGESLSKQGNLTLMR